MKRRILILLLSLTASMSVNAETEENFSAKTKAACVVAFLGTCVVVTSSLDASHNFYYHNAIGPKKIALTTGFMGLAQMLASFAFYEKRLPVCYASLAFGLIETLISSKILLIDPFLTKEDENFDEDHRPKKSTLMLNALLVLQFVGIVHIFT